MSNQLDIFKGFLEKIAVLPMNPAAVKARPASASTSIAPPPQPVKSFVITLKPMKGESKTLKMGVDVKVGELRAKAAEAFSISEFDRCRMIRNGRALQDDSVKLGDAFGVLAAEITLHLLEKPPAENPVLSGWKSSAEAAVWSKIERVLEEEGLTDASARKNLLTKFRSCL